MSAKNNAVKKRLIAEIEDTFKKEPALVIERDGHKWVALQTAYWLGVLGNRISESTFRRLISTPPFVRRTFVVTEADGYGLEDCEYANVLCLRLGENTQSTMDHAKALSGIYHQLVPKKPSVGWENPEWNPTYAACVEPTKTGWKAPDRRELFPSFMKLADLWGEQAPQIFRYVFGHWSEFIALCDGVDRKIGYPSVRTMLRYETTARELWLCHRKAVKTAKEFAQPKKVAA